MNATGLSSPGHDDDPAHNITDDENHRNQNNGDLDGGDDNEEEARSTDPPPSDHSEIVCNACGFEASYVPEGMIPCERCRAVHYCSIHCLQWDWKSGGHSKTCVDVRETTMDEEHGDHVLFAAGVSQGDETLVSMDVKSIWGTDSSHVSSPRAPTTTTTTTTTTASSQGPQPAPGLISQDRQTAASTNEKARSPIGKLSDFFRRSGKAGNSNNAAAPSGPAAPPFGNEGDAPTNTNSNTNSSMSAKQKDDTSSAFSSSETSSRVKSQEDDRVVTHDGSHRGDIVGKYPTAEHRDGGEAMEHHDEEGSEALPYEFENDHLDEDDESLDIGDHDASDESMSSDNHSAILQSIEEEDSVVDGEPAVEGSWRGREHFLYNPTTDKDDSESSRPMLEGVQEEDEFADEEAEAGDTRSSKQEGELAQDNTPKQNEEPQMSWEPLAASIETPSKRTTDSEGLQPLKRSKDEIEPITTTSMPSADNDAQNEAQSGNYTAQDLGYILADSEANSRSQDLSSLPILPEHGVLESDMHSGPELRRRSSLSSEDGRNGKATRRKSLKEFREVYSSQEQNRGSPSTKSLKLFRDVYGAGSLNDDDDRGTALLIPAPEVYTEDDHGPASSSSTPTSCDDNNSRPVTSILSPKDYDEVEGKETTTNNMSSVPRYLRYRNSLSERSPSLQLSQNNRQGKENSLGDNEKPSIAVNNVVGDPAAGSPEPRYLLYRKSLSATRNGNNKERQTDYSPQPSEQTDKSMFVSNANKPLAETNLVNSASSSPEPRYLKYRRSLASNHDASEVNLEVDRSPEKSAQRDSVRSVPGAVTVGAISVATTTPTDSDTLETNASSTPRYLLYRNSLTKRQSQGHSTDLGGTTTTTNPDSSIDTEESPSYTPPTRAATHVQSHEDTVPRYLRYRRSLTTTPSKAYSIAKSTPEPSDLSINSLEPSAHASPLIHEEAEMTPMPRYLQYRNSLSKSPVKTSDRISPKSEEARKSDAESSSGTVSVGASPGENAASKEPRYLKYRNSLAKSMDESSKIPTGALYDTADKDDVSTSIPSSPAHSLAVSMSSADNPCSPSSRYLKYRSSLVKETNVTNKNLATPDPGISMNLSSDDEEDSNKERQERRFGAATAAVVVGAGAVTAATFMSMDSVDTPSPSRIPSSVDNDSNSRYLQYRNSLSKKGDVSSPDVITASNDDIGKAADDGYHDSQNQPHFPVSLSAMGRKSSALIPQDDDGESRLPASRTVTSRDPIDSLSASEGSNEENDVGSKGGQLGLAAMGTTAAAVGVAAAMRHDPAISDEFLADPSSVSDARREGAHGSASQVLHRDTSSWTEVDEECPWVPKHLINVPALAAEPKRFGGNSDSDDEGSDSNVAASAAVAGGVASRYESIPVPVENVIANFESPRLRQSLSNPNHVPANVPAREVTASELFRSQQQKVKYAEASDASVARTDSGDKTNLSMFAMEGSDVENQTEEIKKPLRQDSATSLDSTPYRRRRFAKFCVGLIILIGLPLGIGLGVVARNRKGEVNGFLDATQQPSVAPMTDSPTQLLRTRFPSTQSPSSNNDLLPTQMPSLRKTNIPSSQAPSFPTTTTEVPSTAFASGSPTLAVSGVPTSTPPTEEFQPTPEPDLREEILQQLSAASFDGGESLLSPGTPQNEAFEWLLLNSNVSTMPVQKRIQRYSLATFFYSTQGDSWSNNRGWLSDDDECTWFSRSSRVPVCDGSGAVRNLDLGFNGVGGRLPRELALLSDLVRLGLSGGTQNRITGSLPSELGLLSRLTSLDMFGNALTGSLPTELGNWVAIEVLNLGFNGISGSLPDSIGSMLSLTELDCGLNRLSGQIPASLGNLTNLQRLSFYDNNMTGGLPVGLGGATELRDLNLSGNQLTSLGTELFRLSNLETIRVSRNNIEGQLPSGIGDLTNLRNLDLSSNRLTGVIPSTIGNAINLRSLDLSSNSLGGPIPSEIGLLSRLLNLYLQTNRLVGPIPDELGQLSRISTLRIDNNAITGSVPDAVCSGFAATLPTFYLDCGGDRPNLTCPSGTCCTYCCDGPSCSCVYEGTSFDFLC